MGAVKTDDKEVLKEYIVRYNGWAIHVQAHSDKQARHKAWVAFNEHYPTPYGQFMKGIDGIEAA